MTVTREVVEYLSEHIVDSSFETGGILGSREANVITDLVLDRDHRRTTCHCQYAPNVRFLNESIADWAEKGIRFVGMFHTHIGGSKLLSDADKRYIAAIMHAMPEQVNRLYFPVYVLPERKMEGFLAVREGNDVHIDEEKVEVMNTQC